MKPIAFSANFNIDIPFRNTGTHAFFYYAGKYFAQIDCQLMRLNECLDRQIIPAALICFNIPTRPAEEHIESLLASWGEEVRCRSVFLMEPQTIMGRNWKLLKHNAYDTIFTWRSDLVDNKKYFWLNYSQPLTPRFGTTSFDRKKLCVMIAANKLSYHPDELYTERVAAIRWFEKNQPTHFDLYGRDWDKPVIKYPYSIRSLRRFSFINNLLYRPFGSYRGEIADKSALLRNYKFSICYENSQEGCDYISEKIFDSFLSGCVPIYLGAKNIAQRIPENTYVDMRKFSGYQDLFRFIYNMTEERHTAYLNNIRKFLSGPSADPYRPEIVAKTIVDTIAERL